jgi:hypothetical protein
MSCVERLLGNAARALEPEIQSRMKGFLGGFLRAHLPQTWVFETEDGVASLTVDASGRASVGPGTGPNPDVTVTIPHDQLAAVLARPREARTPPRGVVVTPHTARGRAAFGYLRGRLGL